MIAQTSNDDDDEEGYRLFFYQSDDEHKIPRALLIDLELRVVNSLITGKYRESFNHENVFVAPDGGRAGNS